MAVQLAVVENGESASEGGALAVLNDAVATLRVSLGPCYAEDEARVTVRLSHDRGMRLYSLLRREEPAPIGRPDAIYRKSDHLHTLELCGVVFEWPTRRIAMGWGHYQYI